MIVSNEVVAEVLADGSVILYDPVEFNVDEAGEFIELWWPTGDRIFFLASVQLSALEE